MQLDLIRLIYTSGGCEPLQYCTCTILVQYLYNTVQAKHLAEMAARYKLIYFNARGGAEFIRLILAQAGVEYQDVRIEGEQWPHLRPEMPFGVVPVLEVDGKLLGGSVVIGRYLAEQFGLGGESDLENAQIAAIVDAAYALNQDIKEAWIERDAAKKAVLLKKVMEEVVPSKLPYFERCSCSNQHGWLAGKLTWADLFLYSLALDWLVRMTGREFLNNFPGLTRLCKSLEALPNIAKWLKERPVTEY